MAKRYLETGYYKSPFVRGLKGPLKALYNFIICDCENSGIWTKDLTIASTYIGFEVTEKDFEVFVKAKKALQVDNGKFFFPDFIEHQYPNGLSATNPAHKRAIQELKKYNLVDEDIKVLPCPSGVPTVGTMDKDMGKGMDEEEGKVEVMLNYEFDEFWIDYDKKVGDQKKLKRKWNALTDMEREVIRSHIPVYKKATPDKKYRKNPETYLNQKGWLDEVIISIKQDGKQTSDNRTASGHKSDLHSLVDKLRTSDQGNQGFNNTGSY